MDGASGPVELPPDADRPDADIQYDDDDDIQAVQSEADNYLIDQSEDTCRKVCENRINENIIDDDMQDKEDYCDGERKSDFLGADHTMCKYCVSITKPYLVVCNLRILCSSFSAICQVLCFRELGWLVHFILTLQIMILLEERFKATRLKS